MCDCIRHMWKMKNEQHIQLHATHPVWDHTTQINSYLRKSESRSKSETMINWRSQLIFCLGLLSIRIIKWPLEADQNV